MPPIYHPQSRSASSLSKERWGIPSKDSCGALESPCPPREDLNSNPALLAPLCAPRHVQDFRP